jgi:group I intron endonuclease
MKKIGIYKITSPSEKIYIGQSVDIKRRFKQHKYNDLDTILSRSFKKYGFQNHTFEILEECSVELLNERERYWQEYYNCVSKKGLNSKLTKTNDKSGYVNEETKFKIKISKLSKKQELEYLFEHQYIINDYEERIYEGLKKHHYLITKKQRERFYHLKKTFNYLGEEYIKKTHKESFINEYNELKNDIEFYYLKLDEERQREQDSIDCDNFMNKKKRTD